VRTFRRERTHFWSREEVNERKRGEKQKNAKKRKNLVVDARAGEEPHYFHFLSLSRAIIKSHGLNAREHTHTHASRCSLKERDRERGRETEKRERAGFA
jgi:hypothetical protein